MTQIAREDIISRLRRKAEANGLTLAQFTELGRADELDDPELRDTWLIWGQWITSEDTEGDGR